MPTIFDTLLLELDRLERPADCKLRLWTAKRKAQFDARPEGPEKDTIEDAYRAAMTRHEEWLPTWSAFAIRAVKDYPAERKARIQAIYARHLHASSAAGAPEVQSLVNDLLQRENQTPGLLSPGVAKIMQNWLDANPLVTAEGFRLRGLHKRLKNQYASAADPD